MGRKKGLEALQRTLLIMNYDNKKTLSENTELISEQTAPFYAQPTDYLGRKNPNADYVYNGGGPMAKPQGAIDAKTLFPNGNYPKTVTVKQVQNLLSNQGGFFGQPSISPELMNTIQRGSPNYWKGKPRPAEPTKYEGQILSATGTKLPKKPWGYYEGKLGNYDEQMKQYENDFDSWQQVNDPEGRVNRLRTTQKGQKVPEGFWPSEYDEYLEKIKPYQDIIDNIKQKYTKTKQGARGGVDGGPTSYFDESSMSQGDKNKYNIAKTQIERIKVEYYHSDFKGGISKEKLKEFQSYSKALADYWFPIITQCYSTEMQSKDYGDIGSYTPKRSYVDAQGKIQQYGGQSKALGAKCVTLESQYKNQIKALKETFGYDMRSSFDKIWDDWGDWIQIGGSILLLATGPLAPYLDGAFNLSIASYQLSRGQKGNAAVSVLFAILPGISNLTKIGQVPEKVAANISAKLSEAGGINTSKDLADLIISLPKKEQQWFKPFAKSSPEELKNAASKTIQRYIEKTGQELTPQMEKELTKAFGTKGISRAVKQSGKISFKWPIAKKVAIETTTILTASQFANQIEKEYYESNGERLNQEQIDRVKKVFDTIPKEIHDKVFDEMTVGAITNMINGDYRGMAKEIKTLKEKKLTKEENKKLDDALLTLFK